MKKADEKINKSKEKLYMESKEEFKKEFTFKPKISQKSKEMLKEKGGHRSIVDRWEDLVREKEEKK